MGLDSVAYRRLRHEPAPGWRSVWAIARWNVRLIVRRKLFWLLVAFGLLNFLMHFTLIYIKAQVLVANPGVERFLEGYLPTGTGSAYRDFLFGQSLAVMLVLAYAGVVLITSDHRLGGLAFYLARPIDKFHYIAGKALALWFLVGLMTVAPGLLLFAEYGLFSQSVSYWLENPRIAVGIVGYGALIMAVPSLLLMALATVCRRAAPLMMVWSAIFVVAPAVSELLRVIFDERDWRLLDLMRSLRMIGELCFGAVRYTSEEAYLGWAAVVVTGVFVGSVAVLFWRLRAVDVVK